MQKLEELIAALELAQGPSRELDAGIDMLVSKWSHPRKAVHADIQEEFVLPTVPHFTSSIDAAIALVERVLPGWRGSVQFGKFHEVVNAYISADHDAADELASHAMPAIAVVLSTLRAKLSQEKNNADK